MSNLACSASQSQNVGAIFALTKLVIVDVQVSCIWLMIVYFKYYER